MQAILWLAQPLKTNSADIDVMAVILDQTYDKTAYVTHSAGTIRVEFAHILIADDVSEALWLVQGLASYADLRGVE